MQPNPADTTNFLMLQLIKIVAEGQDAVNDINGLPSSTDYRCLYYLIDAVHPCALQ
jgi:hypothetical protein